MLDPLGNERNFGFLKTAMSAASLRHEVLSANVANIDTPGYKAKDLDFNAIMAEYEDQHNMAQTVAVNERNQLVSPSRMEFKDFIIENELNNITTRFDDNNVNLDQQVAKIASNSGRYRLANQFMTRKIRLLNEVLRV